MLLAYYIAAVNIETAYEGVAPGEVYQPFEGIVLTDTLQLSEADDTFDNVFFPRNNARADRQKALDIRVILGNPPYSGGQGSQNDDNQNLKYPTLDQSIEQTYAKRSTATLKTSLYNSYVRAFRWASNRLQSSPNGGIVAFVSNGDWLDGNTAEGIRHTFADEFHHIYAFNLRGNTRTSGEQARKEGGQTFGPGSRNTIAITLLVRRPGAVPDSGAQIHYRDIGDYLSREEKLKIVAESTVATVPWVPIEPNESADWITLRDPRYDTLLPLTGPDDAIFTVPSNGLKTNRDAWVYNSSQRELTRNVESMVDFFNQQADDFDAMHPRGSEKRTQRAGLASQFVDRDPTRYSWDRSDFAAIASGTRYRLQPDMLRTDLYRPFFQQHVAFDRTLNNETYKLPKLYPSPGAANRTIVVQQTGPAPFFALGTELISDLVVCGAGNPTSVFARWRYEDQGVAESLFDAASGRVSNLNPAGVRRFRDALGDDITDDDVFAYVYGVLHSPDFRETFAVKLKKEAPRVPLVEDRATFDAFVAAGQELLDLHVGYETVEPYPLVEGWAPGSDPDADPKVLLVGSKKMSYPKVADPESGKKVADKTRLTYNEHLTLSGIPLEAHDYVLGTRSGVDWIIDRWYVKTDKASGIVNDVNQWGLERGEPRYIVDLIKRVVTVSVRTVEIVEALPALTF